MKRIELDDWEIKHLIDWHREQVDFCERHDQSVMAAWHKQRLEVLSA